MKNIRVIILVLILAAGATLFNIGCSKESITNIVEDNSPDLFIMSGRVMAYPGNTPLVNAVLSVPTMDVQVTSDAEGNYRIPDIEPGKHYVIVTAPGYATMRVEAQLGSEKTTKSMHHYQDVHMLQLTSTLRLDVIGYPDGINLEGVDLLVSDVALPEIFENHEVDLTSLGEGLVTDSNGIATLDSLPGVSVEITALAHDENGDGLIDFMMAVESFEMSMGRVAEGHLMLRRPGENDLRITVTNIQAAPAVLNNAAAWLVFSMPMDTLSINTIVTLKLYSNPYPSIDVVTRWASSVRLEILPRSSLLDPATVYSMDLSVRSESGLFLRYGPRFHWVTTGEGGLHDCAEPVAELRAAVGHEDVDYDKVSFRLNWPANDCARGYRLYVHDNDRNPGWLHLLDDNYDFDTGDVEVVATLPASFDRFDSDEIQTPFAGTEVTFCVVPMNAVDIEPGDQHATLTVTDNVPFSLVSVIQEGAAHNTLADPTVLKIRVDFSEYISSDCGDPVIQVSEVGGDPACALDPAAGTWSWDSGRHGGYFGFVLEPGQDASGDEIRIEFGDLYDMSGNHATAPAISDALMLDTWTNSFDFESSQQGWFSVGEAWEWGSPSLAGPQAAHSGIACWGTTMNTLYGNNWNTTLYSPELIVGDEAPMLRFWYWCELEYMADYVYFRITTSEGNVYDLQQLTGTTVGWQMRQYSLASYIGKIIRLQVNFVSNDENVAAGFYLDDVSIVYGTSK